MAPRGLPGGDASSAGKRLERLADHLLGYRTTAEPEVLKRGPQPREGVLSVLLQEFPAYTLGQLLAEDSLALEQILDYRRARLAIDLFNQGKQGFEQLAAREDLMAILLELGRAQGGPDVTLDNVYDALRSQRPEKDDD